MGNTMSTPEVSSDSRRDLTALGNVTGRTANESSSLYNISSAFRAIPPSLFNTTIDGRTANESSSFYNISSDSRRNLTALGNLTESAELFLDYSCGYKAVSVHNQFDDVLADCYTDIGCSSENVFGRANLTVLNNTHRRLIFCTPVGKKLQTSYYFKLDGQIAVDYLPDSFQTCALISKFGKDADASMIVGNMLHIRCNDSSKNNSVSNSESTSKPTMLAQESIKSTSQPTTYKESIKSTSQPTTYKDSRRDLTALGNFTDSRRNLTTLGKFTDYRRNLTALGNFPGVSEVSTYRLAVVAGVPFVAAAFLFIKMFIHIWLL